MDKHKSWQEGQVMRAGLNDCISQLPVRNTCNVQKLQEYLKRATAVLPAVMEMTHKTSQKNWRFKVGKMILQEIPASYLLHCC